MIDIQEFARKRPFLYHLTSKANLANIREVGILFSTKAIVELAEIEDRKSFVRTRRPQHVSMNVGKRIIIIRDQRPISLKALSKCLTRGLDTGDFIEVLNQRVFMWPTIERLERHYKRYAKESPIILRFSTLEFIGLNKNVEFCAINSGATRPNSYLGGIAPLRGKQTFRSPSEYNLPIGSIAEVTFADRCILPKTYSKSSHPTGQWKKAT